MKFHGFIGTICVASVLVFSTASGETMSRGEAQKLVLAVEKDQESLLANLPALGQIDQVVRNDCAAKAPSHTGADSFCTCAAALTMSLWRSGADPKMVDRLKDFLNGAGTLKASDFLSFQGPELYRPLCELGT